MNRNYNPGLRRGETVRVGGSEFGMVNGNFVELPPRKWKVTVPRIMGKPITGVKYDRVSKGVWLMIEGKKKRYQGPWVGWRGMPVGMALADDISSNCTRIPTEHYSGVLLSDGAYFYLQMCQYERHFKWILRRYGMKPDAGWYERFLTNELDLRRRRIERKYGIVLGDFENSLSDDDRILMDTDDRVRDLFRRYGRNQNRGRG